MNYTINEISNQFINSADHDHLSFFYKFELKPKEEFASIELNPYIDKDKARLMAANIIAEKIAKKLTYKVKKDEKYGMTTILSFSERHVELEEREVYENFQKQLLDKVSKQEGIIDLRTKTIKHLEEKVKNQRKALMAAIFSGVCFATSALIQFFN